VSYTGRVEYRDDETTVILLGSQCTVVRRLRCGCRDGASAADRRHVGARPVVARAKRDDSASCIPSVADLIETSHWR
jgi:hypothetical protein